MWDLPGPGLSPCPLHWLEKAMAPHSSTLAWRIPGAGEPDGLPSMGSHRVRHNRSDLAAAAAPALAGGFLTTGPSGKSQGMVLVLTRWSTVGPAEWGGTCDHHSCPNFSHSLMVLGWRVRRQAPPDSLCLLPSTLLLFRGNQVPMDPQGGQAQWGL